MLEWLTRAMLATTKGGVIVKRAGIAMGIILVLVAGLQSPASAHERRRTKTVHYTGGPNEWHLFVGSTDAGPGTPAVFSTPSWVRSARVLVRDDTDLPVAYKVRFNRTKGANTGPAHGCGGHVGTFEVPSGTKRLFVQTEAPAWGPVPGCDPEGVPTTGTITVTVSSREA